MRRLALPVVVALLAGCGAPAALFVRVEAPLSVPDECDAVRVTVKKEGAESAGFEETFDLSGGPSFPLTLSLKNAEPANLDGELVVTAAALLGGQPAKSWAEGARRTRLVSGAVTPVTVRICDCADAGVGP